MTLTPYIGWREVTLPHRAPAPVKRLQANSPTGVGATNLEDLSNLSGFFEDPLQPPQ